MSDKLISLEAVVDLIDRSNADLIIKSERYEFIEDIEALPPAELPMSAVEYFKAYLRLCSEHVCWNGCPMMQYKDYDCETFQYNRPDEAVAIVEKWAREHPEERSEEDGDV